MYKIIIPLVTVTIFLSACANADTVTNNTVIPTQTSIHLIPSDTHNPKESTTPLPPTDNHEPTITATNQQSPKPELKSEEIQVSYEDRIIRGTLVGEGDIVVILATIFGETRGIWLPVARHLASPGYTALAFDFPGSGESTGSFSWTKVKYDVATLIDYLQQERGYERIVSISSSVGGIGCFEAAIIDPNLAGLVIISSPLATVTDEEVTKLTMPKLMVVGTLPDEGHEDVTGTMKEIYKLLPDPKQFESIPQRGSALITTGNELRDLLVEFLENLE